MKKLLCLAFIALVSTIVFISCSKDEENLNGTISGLVSEKADANKPISGVSITLSTKGITKTTGNDGRFEFTDLEPGTYTLQAQANTFQTTTKQVTVYAGETITCDFQLEKAQQRKSITITPENVTIAAGMEQGSFTIENNTNEALAYTINQVPEYLQVAPQQGRIAAKGKWTVGVSVLNRQNITEQKTAILFVAIGNDTYPVTITVEPHK